MADFPIKIRADLDATGIKQAAAELSALEKEAKAANEQLAKTAGNAAPAKAIADVGEKAMGAGEKMHGMHAIIRTLGSQFPGLERFGCFLQSGFTAALGVVAIAAMAFKKSLDDLVESLKDLSTGSGAASDYVDKQREATDKAAISASVWRYELDRTASAAETLRQKTEELIQRQKALAQTQRSEEH